MNISTNPCREIEAKTSFSIFIIITFFLTGKISEKKSRFNLYLAISRSHLCFSLSLLFGLILLFAKILRSKLVEAGQKIIFISTVDCGYGVMLAQTLVEKGAKVVAGKLEIFKNIYHSF